jgi:predicted nucleic acid-binding protein
LPGGRPPSPREIFSFEAEDWPPDEVVIDTSFLVNALFTGQNYYRECRAALVELAEANTYMVYSSHLDAELIEAGYKVALKELYGKRWANHRPDGRCRRRAGRIAGRALETWARIADVFDTECIDITRVMDLVPDLMRRYGLKSYDALHVASATTAGVPVLVAVDHDFAGVPASQLRIYTVKSYVPSMRRKRKR